ncbi:MAG: ABC transporter ATP-binding protein [Lewinella sp.]|nr:ABC transporter ATP-binding protein [Lewinella sp.]
MENTSPTAGIRIRGLHKSYGTNHVLRGIDLDIPAGQVIGYIGPNGSGKSTTVRILAGLDGQFTGEVNVGGIDVKSDPLGVKKQVGYVPEQAALYEVLTPREFLLLVGRLHQLPDELIQERLTRMLQFLDLGNHLDQRMESFSKGMRQKVLLTAGLLHDPRIIFLDEPLSGLDANAVMMVKEVIAQLARQGKTIFYSSHMMDVVEKVSNRIVLIGEGRILADGTFEELKQQGGATLEEIFSRATGREDYQQKAGDFLSAFKSDDHE